MFRGKPWDGAVLQPNDQFQPTLWGFAADIGDHDDELGIAIRPQSKTIAKVTVRPGKPDDPLSLSAEPVAVEEFELDDILCERPPDVARFVWLPLPVSGTGFRIITVEFFKGGKPVSVPVGGYREEGPWNWDAGFFIASDRLREAKLPMGLAWRLRARPASNFTPGFEIRLPNGQLVRVRQPTDKRYDTITKSFFGHFTLIEGADREDDPEEFVPFRKHSEYSLYVTQDGCELIKLRQIQPRSFPGHFPCLKEKLENGLTVKICGYGDSITALGDRIPYQISSSNGADRDIMMYFERYGDDWKRKIAPTYDVEGVRAPHRIGWNWSLVRALEKRFSSTVQYENWGIAGTDSSSGSLSIDDVDYPNAANEGRLHRMLDGEPDLVIVAVGMNDIGTGIDTEANLQTIGSAIRAQGADMMIVAPPRPNPSFHYRCDTLWKHTHEAARRAALSMNAPFLSMEELYGDGNEGVLGLSRHSHCAATFGNHPGAYELNRIGDLLSETIIASL